MHQIRIEGEEQRREEKRGREKRDEKRGREN
jgi:hypothetical protein